MRPGSYLLICPPLRCDLRGAVGASGTIILQRIEIHVKPDDTPGAMLQARDAVERRSWSHPQEPTGEAWRADVLGGPSRSQAKPAHRLSRQASILWTRRCKAPDHPCGVQ